MSRNDRFDRIKKAVEEIVAAELQRPSPADPFSDSEEEQPLISPSEAQVNDDEWRKLIVGVVTRTVKEELLQNPSPGGQSSDSEEAEPTAHTQEPPTLVENTAVNQASSVGVSFEEIRIPSPGGNQLRNGGPISNEPEIFIPTGQSPFFEPPSPGYPVSPPALFTPEEESSSPVHSPAHQRPCLWFHHDEKKEGETAETFGNETRGHSPGAS